MFNPIEIKHDLSSRPLKWMYRRHIEYLEETGGVPSDADAIAFVIAGMYTAAVNIYPAAALIHMGQLPPMLFSHTTFKRFNPWAQPIFHYARELSHAEKVGAAAGRSVGRSLAAALRPVTPHLLYKASKGAWKGAGAKVGAKVGARIGGRLIPGVGWALLAYDVYDVAYNRSLWGFDF